MRFTAIVCLVLGGLYPVIAHLVNFDAYLGYVILGGAGGLYILDRMFDVSSSWMRDIAAMQAIDSAIYIYQIEHVRIKCLDVSNEERNASRLRAVENLAESTFTAVRVETAEWRSEFQNAIGDLERLIKPEEKIKPRIDER